MGTYHGLSAPPDHRASIRSGKKLSDKEAKCKQFSLGGALPVAVLVLA